jgi:hypothetical protein
MKILAAIGAYVFQILVIAAVLAGLGALAATGHLDPTTTYGLIMFIIGATGVAAGLVLGNLSRANVTVVVHAVIALLVLALAIVLDIRNVFDETQIVGIFTVLLGSTVTAAVSTSSTAPAVLAAATPDPRVAQLEAEIAATKAKIPGD